MFSSLSAMSKEITCNVTGSDASCSTSENLWRTITDQFLTALVFLLSCVHGQTEAGHSESKLLN